MESPRLKIDLTTFFLSISSAALMSLGIVPPNAEGEEPREDLSKANLELARQNIDLLELMDEKTQGNRSEAEDELLKHLLYQARMRFVDVEKRLEKN